MSSLENSNWKRVTTPFADRMLEDPSSPFEANNAPNFTSSYPCKLEQADFSVDPSLSYDDSLWTTVVGLPGKFALEVVKAVRIYGSIQAIALPKESEANFFHMQFVTPIAVQHAIQTSRSKFFLVGDTICILAIVPCTSTAFATSHRLGISPSESQLKYSAPSQLPIQLNWLYYFRAIYRCFVVCLLLLWFNLRVWCVCLIRKSTESELHAKIQDFVAKKKADLNERLQAFIEAQKRRCTERCGGILASLTAFIESQRHKCTEYCSDVLSSVAAFIGARKLKCTEYYGHARESIAVYSVVLKERLSKAKSWCEEHDARFKARFWQCVDNAKTSRLGKLFGSRI